MTTELSTAAVTQHGSHAGPAGRPACLAECLEASCADLLPRPALVPGRRGQEARRHERLGGLGEPGVRHARVVVCCSVPLRLHGGGRGQKKTRKTTTADGDEKKADGGWRATTRLVIKTPYEHVARTARYPCPWTSSACSKRRHRNASRVPAVDVRPYRPQQAHTKNKTVQERLDLCHGAPFQSWECDKTPALLETAPRKFNTCKNKNAPIDVCFHC